MHIDSKIKPAVIGARRTRDNPIPVPEAVELGFTGTCAPKVLKKWQLAFKGEKINCMTHGLHTRWSVWKRNVKCSICQASRTTEYGKRNPLVRKLIKCKARGWDYNLTLSFIKRLLKSQNNRCALSGQPFESDMHVSIDRIDSTRGYLQDNVQLVTKHINIAKNCLSNAEFISLSSQVAKFWQKESNHHV